MPQSIRGQAPCRERGRRQPESPCCQSSEEKDRMRTYSSSLERNAARTRCLSLQRWAKHCLDWLGAFALILLLLPVFAVIGLMVALEDGRPIIYCRRVVSAKGEFDAFKFRT